MQPASTVGHVGGAGFPSPAHPIPADAPPVVRFAAARAHTLPLPDNSPPVHGSWVARTDDYRSRRRIGGLTMMLRYQSARFPQPQQTMFSEERGSYRTT